MRLTRLALVAFACAITGFISVATAQGIHRTPNIGAPHSVGPAPGAAVNQARPLTGSGLTAAPAASPTVGGSVVIPSNPPTARAEARDCTVAETECAWRCYRDYKLTQLSHRQWCVTQQCEVKNQSCIEKLVEMLDR